MAERLQRSKVEDRAQLRGAHQGCPRSHPIQKKVEGTQALPRLSDSLEMAAQIARLKLQRLALLEQRGLLPPMPDEAVLRMGANSRAVRLVSRQISVPVQASVTR
jgi:hypothetical protein